MNEEQTSVCLNAPPPDTETETGAELGLQIVIAEHPDRPALTIRASQDFAAFEEGNEEAGPSSIAGRLGSMLQAVPSLLTAGEAHGRQLMEVAINGNLVRAADGNGFRAFAMGSKGIREQARLFQPERLQNIINVGAVWQVASILVAQKHLADINRKLDAIADGVRDLSMFMDNQRRAQIEGAYRYLDQARRTLEAGEVPASVRIELEHCERDLLAIESHLRAELVQGLSRSIPHEETIGTEDLAMGISRKIRTQENSLRDIALCIRTRICAWHVLSLFPGEPAHKRARQESLEQAVKEYGNLAPKLEKAFEREIENMHSLFNLGSTLQRRRDALKKQTSETVLKICNTHAGASRLIDDTENLLIRHDTPVRMLLQYQDGVLAGMRQVA
jgi:hypothetical protein